MSIKELLGHDDLDIVIADTGAAALAAMAEQPCDCVVLDLRLPDMSGFEVLERISQNNRLSDVPVVVFTGRELSAEEDARLHTLARSVVVKGVESPERLLDETSLFLHRVFVGSADREAADARAVASLGRGPRRQVRARRRRRRAEHLRAQQRAGAARHEGADREHGQRSDSTARDARLVSSIVLMDIMMPEMDGYQTMQKIRENPELRRLPIVALTAKAMKGDREKCFEAGASDYLAKPVNTEQLLSALRMWLHR